jgi:small-conductance mechanosensitive channel
MSSTYIFHGVKPTLSAGFGQVELSARMAQRRRMVKGLEGVTTRFGLSTDTGSDVGFMTRFHVLHIWRDGSIFYVVLLSVLFLSSSFSSLSGSTMTVGAAASSAQVVLFPLAILAVNWSYYEQGTLWLVTTVSGYSGRYFKGLMLSFALIGLMISAAFLGLRLAVSHAPLTVEDFTVPVIAPIAAAVAACALLTRMKVKPGAFSPSILIVFFVVIVVGVLAGLAVLGFIGLVAGLGPAAQVVALALVALVLIYAGLETVARFARGFVAG